MSRKEKWGRRLKQILVAAGWLYGIYSLMFVIGRYTIGERWTLIEISNSLTPPVLLPACLLTPLMVYFQRKRIALLMLPALVLLIGHYATLFLPSPREIPANTIPLKILTFNIGSHVDDYPAMIALVRSVDADVVAVQELLTAPARELTTGLADLYPYTALHPTDIFAGGVGVFSRLPLIDDVYLDEMSLGGQRTRIALNDERMFTLFNVHPTSPRVFGGYNSARRSGEVFYVLELAAQETNPVLLNGDFNLTDLTDDYLHIASFYGDAFREAGTGFGLTFPNLGKFARPLELLPSVIRIDYVFFSDDWLATDAYVPGDAAGSDHYPLVAELVLK